MGNPPLLFLVSQISVSLAAGPLLFNQGQYVFSQQFSFLFFSLLYVYVYNTVLKALCSWSSSEWLPIASESTTPSWTHHLAPWIYLLVKAPHAQSQSDMTLGGKSWVWLWHFGKWVRRGYRSTVWLVRGYVLLLSAAICRGRTAQEGPRENEFLISRVIRQWIV